jgi:hypothetical protein
VRHAQVRAHQVGLNKSYNPDEKEYDAKKFTDSFCHNSLLSLLYEKSVYNRKRCIVFLKGRFRVFSNCE